MIKLLRNPSISEAEKAGQSSALAPACDFYIAKERRKRYAPAALSHCIAKPNKRLRALATSDIKGFAMLSQAL